MYDMAIALKRIRKIFEINNQSMSWFGKQKNNKENFDETTNNTCIKSILNLVIKDFHVQIQSLNVNIEQIFIKGEGNKAIKLKNESLEI